MPNNGQVLLILAAVGLAIAAAVVASRPPQIIEVPQRVICRTIVSGTGEEERQVLICDGIAAIELSV